ncbi:MAG: HIT domain-containing protein [Smithellaceae bacterium]|nr:HIT domain-containing protein [Smithellaceae bacterium]
MKTIFAPWRMAYIKGEKPEGCVFCKDSVRCSEYVLYEGKTAFVIMNCYPYTSGHLMIVPTRHVGALKELTAEERLELMDLLVLAEGVLREAIAPEGFNIGVNLGKAAGAGVDDHLHLHIVPRWCGDTNYMSVIDDVRIIPEDLAGTYEKLLPFFNRRREGAE